jgi:hypothetical protein
MLVSVACAFPRNSRRIARAIGWLDPVELVVNYGFNVRDLNLIREIIEDYRDDLLEAWHEHLGR